MNIPLLVRERRANAQVSTRWSARTIALAGLLALGCSGEGVAFESEGAVQPLVCSETSRTTPSGKLYVDVERYHPDAMNALLAESAVLRTAVGLSEVASCEEARHFTAVRNALSIAGEYQPPIRQMPAHHEGFLTKMIERLDPARLRKLHAGSSRETPSGVARAQEPIYNGTMLAHDGAVQIDTEFKGQCTAFPIGKRVINGAWWTTYLTSAHCLNGKVGEHWPDYDANYYYGWVDIWHTTSPGNRVKWGTTLAHHVWHDLYTGANDIAVDIGFLSAYAGDFEYPSANLTDIYKLAVTTSLDLTGLGFGVQTVGGSTLRTAVNNALFRIDGGNVLLFFDNNDGDIRLCQGDSGGPALLWGRNPAAAVGIASAIDPLDGCAAATDGKYWTKTKPYFESGWVQQFHGACRTVFTDYWRCW
jgi:hypothetical protein